LVRLDGVRVFLVDDEADARRILAMLLERVGAVVTTASNAAEALQLLPRNPSQVLISDIGMPDEDGLSLIRKLRQLGYGPKDLPAIALTAYAHDEDARRTLAAGFQVHVAKPVDPHRLTSLIASLVTLPK
jgi:CheY-like chemotaxis protein